MMSIGLSGRAFPLGAPKWRGLDGSRRGAVTTCFLIFFLAPQCVFRWGAEKEHPFWSPISLVVFKLAQKCLWRGDEWCYAGCLRTFCNLSKCLFTVPLKAALLSYLYHVAHKEKAKKKKKNTHTLSRSRAKRWSLLVQPTPLICKTIRVSRLACI